MHTQKYTSFHSSYEKSTFNYWAFGSPFFFRSSLGYFWSIYRVSSSPALKVKFVLVLCSALWRGF